MRNLELFYKLKISTIYKTFSRKHKRSLLLIFWQVRLVPVFYVIFLNFSRNYGKLSPKRQHHMSNIFFKFKLQHFYRSYRLSIIYTSFSSKLERNSLLIFWHVVFLNFCSSRKLFAKTFANRKHPRHPGTHTILVT